MTTTNEPITMSLLRSPLTAAILDGDVDLDGATLQPIAATSVDANSRTMLELGFDVAEMSFATYLRARVVEQIPLLALPVFTGRRFVQPLVVCAPDSAVRAPGDLHGRRACVPQFWMTSSMWHRGVLQSYYHVEPSSVEWLTTAPERIAGLPTTGFTRVEEARPVDLLREGRVDCVMSPKALRERAIATVPLFQDVVAEQRDYFLATGVFPIMHLVVAREPVLRERPRLADEITDLFQRAKSSTPQDPPVPGMTEAETRRVFGTEPWPYGISANNASLTAFLDYAVRQGLVERAVAPTDIFV